MLLQQATSASRWAYSAVKMRFHGTGLFRPPSHSIVMLAHCSGLDSDLIFFGTPSSVAVITALFPPNHPLDGALDMARRAWTGPY
jgi:hypothetical protein